MPELTPTKLFLKDLDAFESNTALHKKIRKALALLHGNPFHPGLRMERIANDPTAWSIRIDRRYRLSIDPVAWNDSGAPDWDKGVILLRMLDHDDLYKKPR